MIIEEDLVKKERIWGIWVWKDGDQELWTEHNWHLLWGKPRSNFKGCSVDKEEEEEEEGEGGGKRG